MLDSFVDLRSYFPIDRTNPTPRRRRGIWLEKLSDPSLEATPFYLHEAERESWSLFQRGLHMGMELNRLGLVGGLVLRGGVCVGRCFLLRLRFLVRPGLDEFCALCLRFSDHINCSYCGRGFYMHGRQSAVMSCERSFWVGDMMSGYDSKYSTKVVEQSAKGRHSRFFKNEQFAFSLKKRYQSQKRYLESNPTLTRSFPN